MRVGRENIVELRPKYQLFFWMNFGLHNTIDNPTFLQYGVLIFWVYQEISDGAAFFEIYLHSMFPADVFAAFS